MKPEYIGVGNFDEDNYVYSYCKCPFSADYAIKWPRIKDGKVHTYTCTCEGCGTEVGVISKSYGPEVYEEKSKDCVDIKTVLNNLKFSVTNKKGTGMTKEEAIKELSYIIDEMPSMECADWIEAISMGIKALAQEPCGDAISRQAVLDTISELNAISFYEAQEDSKECYYEIRNAIKQLPPVKPAEKVGKWEWEEESFTKNWGNWHCSKCREIITVCETEWAKINKPNYKYCPDCGAKMQEVIKE